MEQAKKSERPSGGDRPASSTGEWRLADQHPTLRRMEFSMTVAAPARLAPPALSTDHLLDTPLPQLLAELDVDVYDSSIPDRSFFGAVGRRSSGQLFLALPRDRSAFERDTTARYLLAKAFDMALPDLPAPFETSRL